VASAASTDSQPAGETPPASSASATSGAGTGISGIKRFLLLKEGSIIVVTAITLIYFAASTSNFFTIPALKNLLPYFAPYAITAAGEVWVMINGQIDLSIGGTYLISPFIFNEFTGAHIPLIPAMLLALIVCGAVGVINGFFVSVVGINSFVATLGSLFSLFGITLVMSHSTQINTPGTSVLGGGTFETVFGGGVYSELFWALGIVIVLQIALTRTRWGIYTVAVGGNRLGAQEAGINEKSNMIRNFALCALLAGFTGILEAVRVGNVAPDPSAPNEFLFQAISAAVIGGTLLVGGYGTVVGALIGALFLGVIYEGLVIKSVSADYQYLYVGLAILIAMTINIYIARVRTRSGLG
jgi:simple sugar transport system permease protein